MYAHLYAHLYALFILQKGRKSESISITEVYPELKISTITSGNKPFSMSIKFNPASLSSQVRSRLIQSVKKKLSSASFLHVTFDLCLTKDGQHRSSVSNALSGSDLFYPRISGVLI